MIVVDASAIAAVLFNEHMGEEIERRLEGEVLVAPPLIHLEMANACLKRIIRHPEARDLWFEALMTLGDWQIALDDVDLRETVSLAALHGLTAYDASYLWLSRELGAELVTLDAKLARAYSAMTGA